MATPTHVHTCESEAWFVLDGTITYRAGTELVELTAGDFIYLPRNVPHAFGITGKTPAHRDRRLRLDRGQGRRVGHLHGVHTGPYVLHDSPDVSGTGVFPPIGRAFAVRQVHWFRIVGDAEQERLQIAEHDAVRDDLGMARQVGWIYRVRHTWRGCASGFTGPGGRPRQGEHRFRHQHARVRLWPTG